tara:strand:- start:107 stop:256 length:150 start_codon:yes stop_codon:yes gene_type:complete
MGEFSKALDYHGRFKDCKQIMRDVLYFWKAKLTLIEFEIINGRREIALN